MTNLVLRIQRGTFKGKIIIANTEQLFSLIETYKNDGFSCLVDIE